MCLLYCLIAFTCSAEKNCTTDAISYSFPSAVFAHLTVGVIAASYSPPTNANDAVAVSCTGQVLLGEDVLHEYTVDTRTPVSPNDTTLLEFQLPADTRLPFIATASQMFDNDSLSNETVTVQCGLGLISLEFSAPLTPAPTPAPVPSTTPTLSADAADLQPTALWALFAVAGAAVASLRC